MATTSNGACWRRQRCQRRPTAVIDVGYPTRVRVPCSVPLGLRFRKIIWKPCCSTICEGLATAHIELGVTVEDAWEARAGLRLKLRDGGSGASRVVQAEYVIGADGARSVVRRRLGISVSETEDLLEALSVLVHAPLWEVFGRHRYGIYVTDVPAPRRSSPRARETAGFTASAGILDPNAWPISVRISSSSGSGLAPASQTFPYASSIRTHSASRGHRRPLPIRQRISSLATPPTG